MIIDKTAFEQMIEHLSECARDAREGVGLLSSALAGPVRHGLVTACPDDTDGDGNCGRKHCPHCGDGRPALPTVITNTAVDRWTPLANVSEYPRLRYEVDPGELIEAYEALEAAGYRPAIMVHSHVRGGSLPSATDIRYATNPALLHLIVDLQGSRPAAKLWHITPNGGDDGQVRTVRYQVADLQQQGISPTDLTHRVSGA